MTRRAAIVVVLALALVLAGVALASSGAGGELRLRNYLFGPKLVRAEVVVRDSTGLHDLLVDRGNVLRSSQGVLRLRERDGSTVTIPVSPSAQVQVDGMPSSLAAVGRGMVVTAIRSGDGPATQVFARRR